MLEGRDIMRNNIRYASCATIVILIGLFIFGFKASAASTSAVKDIEIKVVGEDEEGVTIYSFGDGQFYSNVTDGQTVELGYFRWDDKLNITMMKDGKQFEYEPEDIIYENGEYVAVIYDIASSEIGTIKFTVKNSVKGIISDGDKNDDDKTKEPGGFDDFEAILGDMSSGSIAPLSISYEFDSSKSVFKYYAAGDTLYYSDIPNNAISTDPVAVRTKSGSMAFTYKDGQVMVAPKDSIYKEPGFYDIVTYIYSDDDANIPADERASDTRYYATHFVFTIIKPEDGSLGVISAPEQFVFSKIVYNGEEMELPSGNYFFPEGDGEYKFTFESKDGGRLSYEVEYTRDTVAPFLSFNQKLKNNKGKPPLSYTVNDPEAKVYVTSGDTKITMAEGEEINYTGWYKFKVVDKAGNVRYYSVFMKSKPHFFSPGMKLLIGMLLFFILAYLLTVRFTKYDIKE